MSGVTAQMTGLIALQEIADKLDSFEDDLYKFFKGKINSQWKDILIAYNEYNLDLGIRPDESEIEKTPSGKQKSTRYERYTEYLKTKRGQEIGVVNLEDKGDFRKAIQVEVGLDFIYFINRDWKADIIETTWCNVLGITQEQLDEFVFDVILPEFYKWTKARFAQ